jgi:hypothetical protein
MNIEVTKLRDEWRQLNIKIAQHQRTVKINTLAGQKFSSEYLNFLDELILRRDYLTNLI